MTIRNFLDKIKDIPPVYSNLGELAPSNGLHKIEEELNVIFPQAFHDLYSFHNGQKDHFGVGLFFGLTFLNLEEIIRHWRRQLPEEGAPRNEFASSGIPETVKSGYRNAKWIPFAYDHGGNYIGLDFDPGKNGVKGQVINFGRDEEVNYILGNSFQLFLDWYTHQLDSSNYIVKTSEDGYEEPSTSFGIKNPPADHFFDVLKDIF